MAEEMEGAQESGQAPKNETGVRDIDLSGVYRHPRRPQEEVSGEDIYAGYQRGKKYDSLQSEHHKLQEAYKQLQQSSTQYKAELEALKQNTAIEQKMREMMPQSGLDWLNGSEGEEPSFDPKSLADLRAEIEANILNKLTSVAENKLPELFNTYKKQEEEGERLKQTFDRVSQTEIESLRYQYPDIEEKEIKEYMRLSDLVRASLLESLQATMNEDSDAVEESQLNYMTHVNNQAKKLAEIQQRQAQIKAENEANAEVEAFSAGRLPQNFKPDFDYEKFNPYDRRQRDAKHKAELDAAKRLTDIIRAKKSALPS